LFEIVNPLSILKAGPPVTLSEIWCDRWRTHWKKTVRDVIGMGRMLIQGRDELGTREFHKIFKDKKTRPFEGSYARRFMGIAGDPRICAHAHKMPLSPTTLHLIHTMDDEEFNEALAKGIIRPSVERRNIQIFLDAKKAEKRDKNYAEVAKTLPALTDRYELHNASFEELLRGPPEIADFVFADPPYARQWAPHYDLLARVAAYVLKPGCSFVCMPGNETTREAGNAFARYLDDHGLIMYLLEGGPSKIDYHRMRYDRFKPILWFTKGRYPGPLIDPIAHSSQVEDDKAHYKWQQSRGGMIDLLRQFIRPGMTVLDPVMGSGTTGIAALELRAGKFIGYDHDPEAFHAAMVRFKQTERLGKNQQERCLTYSQGHRFISSAHVPPAWYRNLPDFIGRADEYRRIRKTTQACDGLRSRGVDP
jgi:16S rRNA G966 N2-methylase RsmD